MNQVDDNTGTLLGPDDPPAISIFNPDGAAPVIVVCDHASNAVPQALDRLGLDERELNTHITLDIGAADVARQLAERLDAPAVLSGYSRLVIDCNRRLDHESSIIAKSDGVMIPGNGDLDAGEVSRRAKEIFWPYHRRIGDGISGFAQRGIKPAILSVHTFTAMIDNVPRPWHVGVLWDRDPRIAVPLIGALRAAGELEVGDNQPYSGRQKFGYSIETHATETGLPSALIEIREDMVDDAAGASLMADILARALKPILAEPGLYRSERF
jgi:predicted N-formylglutamate amidohydrolase